MENKTSLVDIILPNFNKAKFLDQTIKSIINQSFRNFTLYIIDDFSNDNSIEIIKKYTDARIKLTSLKENKGVSYCRNLGLGFTKSKYIAFIDSDDYWEKNKLENQIKFMDEFNHSLCAFWFDLSKFANCLEPLFGPTNMSVQAVFPSGIVKL